MHSLHYFCLGIFGGRGYVGWVRAWERKGRDRERKRKKKSTFFHYLLVYQNFLGYWHLISNYSRSEFLVNPENTVCWWSPFSVKMILTFIRGWKVEPTSETITQPLPWDPLVWCSVYAVHAGKMPWITRYFDTQKSTIKNNISYYNE